MEVVAAARRCQLLLIMLMAAMLLPGMKVSPLFVRRKITRTVELQESIGKETCLSSKERQHTVDMGDKGSREDLEGEEKAPLVPTILPPSLQHDSLSSAKCLAVGLCICFHQLLDEGSLMTTGVVTILITGDGFAACTIVFLPRKCSFNHLWELY
ncbi:hypothetical protein STEG23_012076 [Scotinomys teguina]